jgi:hypothetical protein
LHPPLCGRAGHYVPQLSEKIFDGNRAGPKESYINFKGLMVGNALMDDETDQTGMIDYAWDHAVISDQVYGDVKAKCDFSKVNVTDACDAALQEYFAVYRLIDMYSLYTPVCTDPGSSASSSHRKVAVHGAAPRIFSKYVRAFEHPFRFRDSSTAIFFCFFASNMMMISSFFFLRAARMDHEAGGLRPLHGGVRGGLLQPARRPGGAARERDQDRLQLDTLQVRRRVSLL